MTASDINLFVNVLCDACVFRSCCRTCDAEFIGGLIMYFVCKINIRFGYTVHKWRPSVLELRIERGFNEVSSVSLTLVM